MSFKRFHESVRRLAAQASEQEEYLRALGTAPSLDELALEFEADFRCERNHLSPASCAAADLLNQCLSRISGEENADLWSVSALYNAPEWTHVRKLAAELLRCIDEQPRPASGPICDRCGQHIPKFNNLSEGDEERVLELIRLGNPGKATLELEALVGCPRDWAKLWVLHRGKPQPRLPGTTCPHCGGRLRTPMAKQCLECGMDWHDPTNSKKLGRG